MAGVFSWYEVNDWVKDFSLQNFSPEEFFKNIALGIEEDESKCT